LNYKKEIFYISNLLSLSRFIFTGMIIYLMNSEYHNKYLISLLFIIVTWLSDLFDGYFARKRNEITELGKMIDPLSDKFCVISITLILTLQNIIPYWFMLIIVLRDIIIFIAGVYLKFSRKIVLQSNRVGKISVFIIGLTLLFSIFYAHIKYYDNQIFFSYHTENLELFLKYLIILSITMSIVSLFVYFLRFFSIVVKKNY
jgi:cardiolipin synthase